MALDYTDISRRIARALFIVGVPIVVATSLTPVDAFSNVETSDKLMHIVAYGALATCGAFGFPKGMWPLWIGVGLTILGACLEGMQSYVPDRTMSFGDMVANVVGIGLGLAAVYYCERRMNHQSWLK